MAKAGSNLNLDGQGNPVWLLLELTYKCPLKCAFCSNPTDLDDHQDELTTAEWKTVIQDARKMGAMQIGFSGGEPTLRKDLEELVAEANELGYYTNLITSGIGLTRKRLENLKKAGLRHIQLGFQSSDPQTAHWLAGVDCYEKKVNMAREIKALGFPMVLNMPISSLNIHQVPDIIDLAADIGVEYLELANVQYYNWALVNRDQLMPTREALETAEAQVAEARKQLGDKMTIFFVIPDYYEGRPKACMNGWGSIHLTIAPDGVVLPCQQARSLPDLNFPGVRDHDLSWIWHESESFNLYRGDSWMKEPCRSCPEKERDFGGCRCQAMLLTGDAANADPACSKSPQHHIVQEAVIRALGTEQDHKKLIARDVSWVPTEV
ncbi:pyrroloquinoline quinone biosynthesis protein PqqE [Marinobacter sp. Arc7-DN-1]|uniref:pyrroloquinoline quinone biosynthesis protein PqqE n=1 Tax=Marinobacter sp. Arc7-DN-1 TaxID=2304594 RepID=UPI000E4494BD|nr:pyrroloquinoline quinone biosynthesis protein PqqE [Marinobacter sp. Arc7-DN-1]AXS83011.1 pyrroloquinoline quinone biosynthesis protein PqqE [Marinobacter sp. Arc7-DN-1]